MPRIVKILFVLSCLLCLLVPIKGRAQAWSGLLNPTFGSGACNPASVSSPQKCAIDWSTAGVIGGIPSGSWTQSGSTITATSGDRTATIQAALNSCGTNHYILLGPGVFSVTHLTVPSNCELRGAGTLTSSGTIVSGTATSGSLISIGSGGGPNYTSPASTTITSGATAGSTSIGVSSASGISTGTLLAISEINDPVYVTIHVIQGNCTFCDGTGDGGVRARGQVVRVTNVSGTTLTISPGLYTNYGSATGTGPALAYYYQPGGQNAGVYLLQTYANGTGYAQTFNLSACYDCWIKGVFDNYSDGDHVDIYWSLHYEIRDSYFSNAYLHTSGSADSDIDCINKSSDGLIENNILERLHVGIMWEWGCSGNVFGYNYSYGNFDQGNNTGNPPPVILASFGMHGAHTQFNLLEGNVGNTMIEDSFWGTGSNDTTFRNQFRGTDTLAQPLIAGRQTVNWSSTQFATQQMNAQVISYPHTNNNSIGNIFGSADAVTAATSGLYNGGLSPFTSTVIPSSTRNYQYWFYATSIGYDTGSDTNGSGVTTFASGPSNTAGYWVGLASGTFFQHGNFDIASNSIIWNGAVTHTLPTSFYRSTRPSWFGSVPWPAMGPDVTGGSVDTSTLAGHVNAIPAEACYNSESRDATGIKLFDPTVCYYGSTPPNPPSGLHVIIEN